MRGYPKKGEGRQTERGGSEEEDGLPVRRRSWQCLSTGDLIGCLPSPVTMLSQASVSDTMPAGVIPICSRTESCPCIHSASSCHSLPTFLPAPALRPLLIGPRLVY